MYLISRTVGRIRFSSLFVAILFSIGCQSIDLLVAVDPNVPAMVGFETIEGDPDDERLPRECPVPCEVELRGGTAYRMEIEADGYYPVDVLISYTTAFQSSLYSGKHGSRAAVVIPLVPIGSGLPSALDALPPIDSEDP